MFSSWSISGDAERVRWRRSRCDCTRSAGRAARRSPCARETHARRAARLFVVYLPGYEPDDPRHVSCTPKNVFNVKQGLMSLLAADLQHGLRYRLSLVMFKAIYLLRLGAELAPHLRRLAAAPPQHPPDMVSAQRGETILQGAYRQPLVAQRVCLRARRRRPRRGFRRHLSAKCGPRALPLP